MNKEDIKRFRYQHKLKQRELAELLNMNDRTLSAYEGGRLELSAWFRKSMRELMDELGYDQFAPMNLEGRHRIADAGYKRPPYKTKKSLAQSVVEGVSPDQPIVYNEQGGGQSDTPYRMDLVDPLAILEIAKVLKEGADKYGANNWKQISIEDHLNHLLVHVYAYLAGDTSDDHLSHASCRALFALGVAKDG